MGLFYKVKKDFVGLAPGVCAQLLGGFVVSLLAGKILDPERFGVFTLLWLTQAYGAIVLFGWLQNATVRFVAADNRCGWHYFMFTMKYALAITMVCMAVGWVVGQIFRLDWRWVYLTAALLVSSSLYSSMQSFFRARFRTNRYSWYAFLLAILKVSGLFFVWRAISPSHDLIAAVLMVMVLAHALVLALQIKSYRALASHAAPSTGGLIRSGMKYGVPLAVSLLLISLLQSSDRVLLTQMLSLHNLGVYAFWMGIGMQLGQGLYRMLFMALNPRLFQSYEDNPSLTVGQLCGIVFFYSLIMAPLAVIVGCYLPVFIETLGIKKGYSGEGWILVFGMISAYLMGLAQLFGKVKEFEGATLWFVWAALGAIAVMFSTLVVLVPAYRLIGACLANVTGFLAYALVLLWVGGDMRRSFLAAAMWGMVVAGMMFGVAWETRESFGVVYGLLLTIICYAGFGLALIAFIKKTPFVGLPLE